MVIRELGIPMLEADGVRRRRPESMPASAEVIGELVKITDLFLIIAAAAAGYLLYHAVNHAYLPGGPRRYLLQPLFAGAAYITIMTRLSGYNLRRLIRLRWQLPISLYAWMLAILLLIMLAFLGKLSVLYSRFWVVAFAVLAPTLLLVERTLLSLLLRRNARTLFVRNIAVVGAGEPLRMIAAKLQNRAEDGLAFHGVFAEDPSAGLPGFMPYGGIDNLFRLAQQVNIDRVILALPLAEVGRIKAAIDRLKLLSGEIAVSVGPIGDTLPVRGLSYVGGVPMIEVVGRPMKAWALIFKWIEDKVVASLALILLAPLMAIIAFLIKLDSPGPVLFQQDRYGFCNSMIKVFKFRTMHVDQTDPLGRQLTRRGDPRVTRVGRLLRGLSLDELPQLLNVLCGEMSLVGPRPHALAALAGGVPYDKAVDDYALRHRVKPGITGWAQVNGWRGETERIEQLKGRIECDLYYIENWSLALDFLILGRTVFAVLSRQNAV